MADIRFEEKILYKSRQHWIIPVSKSLQYLFVIVFPLTLLTWFMSSYSFVMTSVGFFIFFILVNGYLFFLWRHSWLFIGNQKVTLSVRNGIFSQYAMNIRYRNIRDSAVSKNNLLGFLLKYGTLFIRSTNSEGDFTTHYVPKVGKIYALINALSRYSDDERSRIDTIEKLHTHHTKTEFSGEKNNAPMTMEVALLTLKNTPGIVDAIELSEVSRSYLAEHEESRNLGVHAAISRNHSVCLIHNSDFRDPIEPLVDHLSSGEVEFPGIPFPEVYGRRVISGSPSAKMHQYLGQFFPYAEADDATIIVGWDS